MVTLTAPAKLTLSLRITGVRPDGMHEIDAEMVSVDLHDTIEVTPGGHGVEIVDHTAGSRQRAAIPHGEQNLALRALKYAGREARLALHKRIPAGAGLGGGSSDAAAVLRWAGITDPEEGALIGSDVAFCLVGGRGRVTGAGEIIEPLPFESRALTLLIPPFGCSTPAVYRAWDELSLRGDLPEATPGGNDLEAAAIAVEPELTRWRDELASATGQTPRLAGSGSTWFVEGRHPGPGRLVVETVPAGWQAPS